LLLGLALGLAPFAGPRPGCDRAGRVVLDLDLLALVVDVDVLVLVAAVLVAPALLLLGRISAA